MPSLTDERVPCPHCGEGIRQGARKCPHCRAYLDAALAEDRAAQVEAQVAHRVDVEELEQEVRSTALAAGVGTLLLCFIGLIGGPAVLGYALWFHHRARRLQLATVPHLRLCYGFAGAWLVTGAVTAVAFWWYVIRGGR